MENITVVAKTDEITGEVTEHIIIDRGNGEYTSMTKEHWDKLEAEREQSGTL
jgi:hypothetical protein